MKKAFLTITIVGLLNIPMASIAQKSTTPILIFQSGFEGSARVVADSGTNDHGAFYEHIAGFDNSLSPKSNWDKDWATVLKTGAMQVQYTGGDSTKRYAKVVPEPGNPSNHVLKFWLDGSWVADLGLNKARVQTNIYGIKEGFKDFYQSVRVFLTEDFAVLRNYPRPITWLTLSEFWNNEWWVEGEKYGFRTGLVAGKMKAEDNDLYFLINAENAGQKQVWRETNTNVKVPIGKWFTMEYYYKEGNAETGRVYLAITPEGGTKQVVYDIHNFTQNTTDPNPDGFTGYNPMKLYTSPEVVAFVKTHGKTLQIYWDDFKLWTNKIPE